MAKTSGGVRKGKSSHATSVPLAAHGAPPVHGEVDNTLMRHLAAIEDDPAYFNRNTERMYVFNPDGSLDFTISQHREASVSMTSAQKDRLKGKILVHNHPSGGAFSSNDVLMAIQADLLEVRATGRKGTYIMHRPKQGWPSDITSKSVRTVYFMQRIGIPISENEWSTIARHIGADYAFVKRQLY